MHIYYGCIMRIICIVNDDSIINKSQKLIINSFIYDLNSTSGGI
jgi:hypothetical protein